MARGVSQLSRAAWALHEHDDSTAPRACSAREQFRFTSTNHRIGGGTGLSLYVHSTRGTRAHAMLQ
eukprot:5705044-Alexandrium_andersonii.AAC.1